MVIINDIYKESPTKAKSRLKILATAFELFSLDGIDSVSLTKIADASNITIRNLYRYYPSKESVIADTAYYYVSLFNSNHEIIINSKLSGYDQLAEILEDQIIDKFLSKDNYKIVSFFSYFNVYMTKVDISNEAIKKYIDVYIPLLRKNIIDSFKRVLVKGVNDNTLNLRMDEVDYYVGYIFHSITSIVSSIALKRYEKDIQKYDFIHKHISIILSHLKK